MELYCAAALDGWIVGSGDLLLQIAVLDSADMSY